MNKVGDILTVDGERLKVLALDVPLPLREMHRRYSTGFDKLRALSATIRGELIRSGLLDGLAHELREDISAEQHTVLGGDAVSVVPGGRTHLWLIRHASAALLQHIEESRWLQAEAEGWHKVFWATVERDVLKLKRKLPLQSHRCDDGRVEIALCLTSLEAAGLDEEGLPIGHAGQTPTAQTRLERLFEN